MQDVELTRALDQISEIHGHLARGEVYRGYRPVPVALSAVLGIAAAGAQSTFVPAGDAYAFLRYWGIVGALAACVAASGVIAHFLFHSDGFARRRTLHVLGQLAPALVAGGVLTCGMSRHHEAVPLLPALWAIVFGLGVFSSRPYLPRLAGWIGLWYLAAGAYQLLHPGPIGDSAAWHIGVTFGLGQLASALMLYFDVQRCAENG
jgi:hypothetical protein